MRRNKQLVTDKEKGDCMRACLTSMLGLPNDPDIIPLGGAGDWWVKCRSFLVPFGLELIYEAKAFWRGGYWMAGVVSKNYKDCTHSIVMNGDKVWHDPSTKKRYRTGTSLLGKDIVKHGFYLEVTDPSLLHKFVEYQKEWDEKEARMSKVLCTGELCLCACEI